MSSQARVARLLGGVARNPSTILRALPILAGQLEEDVARHRVRRTHGASRGLPTIDLLELFSRVDEVVSPYAYLEGSSLPTDIVLLRLLARRVDDCRYFEIGSWRGESLRNVAAIAGDCISVSLSDERPRSGVLPPGFRSQFHFFSRDLPNVRAFDANSMTFDYEPFAGSCDLVFIDGSHSYDAVVSDTRNAFGLLKDRRSVVVWHDYGFSPERVRWSVLEAILDGCTDAQRQHLYHVSNTMCAVYIQDLTLATSYSAFPTTPNKTFEMNVSARRLEASRSPSPSR